MIKKRVVFLLTSVVLLAGLVCCSHQELFKTIKNTDELSDRLRVEQWFSETEGEDILAMETNENLYAIVSGTNNPGTHKYTGIKLSLVRAENMRYSILEQMEGEYITSVGFTLLLCRNDDIAVMFGTVGDSIFDFKNDDRLSMNFSELVISIDNEEKVVSKLSNNTAFVAFLPNESTITEIEFVGDDYVVKYSDFYDLDSLNE